MKTSLNLYICLGLPVLLAACGSDTPSFIEKPESIITLSVAGEGDATAEADENAFSVEDALADSGISYSGDLSEDQSSDLTASNTADGGTSDSPASRNNGSNSGSANTGSADVGSKNTGSSTAGSTSGTTASSSQNTATTVDAKTVAQACAPHFRGLSQKIRVIDADSASPALSISPNTIIAFKVAGNQTKLTINLPAGNDIAGVCFFVSGNMADVTFSSASQIGGFGWIGSGNQSKGNISFTGGSPSVSHIEMKGNHPSLTIQGMDSELCGDAIIKGTGPQLQCRP